MDKRILITLIAIAIILLIGIFSVFDLITLGDQLTSQLLILIFQSYKLDRINDKNRN